VNDALLVVALAVVTAGLGLPAVRLLPARPSSPRLLAAPVFGLAILAVLVTAGYRFGVSPGVCYALAGAAALASLAVELRRRLAEGADGDERSWLVLGAGTWLAAFALLLLPRFVGGDQFAVFQGNQWDTFGYLESALVYAREPFSFVSGAGLPEYLRNPLFQTASGNLYARPTAHLLYAAASRVAPAEAYRLHYAFLCFLLSLTVPVAVLALRSWLPRAPRWAVALAAPVFALGFWGQYVLDINAWSQIASVSILLLAFVLLVEAGSAGPEESEGAAPWRLAGAIAVLAAGAIYVYPESLVYHLAVLGPLAAAAIALRWWRGGRRSLRPFAPLLGLGGVLAGVLYWKGTIGFVLGQVKLGTSGVNWWHFFQGFFFGRTGEPGAPSALAAGVDFVAAFLGLYFATPAGTAPAILAATQRLLLAAGMVAVVLAAWFAVRTGVRPTGKEDRRRPRQGALPPAERSGLGLAALACVALYVPALRLATTGNYWSAGKAVSFVSPILVLVLALPIAVTLPARVAWLRWASGAFVAFQLALGVARIAGAADPTGVHFAAPYPALQEPPLKQVLRWDVAPLAGALAGAQHVLVAPMNAWSSHWVMCFLYARGVDYFSLSPIQDNFAAGKVIGQAEPPWEGDAMVGLSARPRGFVVQYAGGRPPALVAWPEPVR
jgi:hypothetical protein